MLKVHMCGRKYSSVTCICSQRATRRIRSSAPPLRRLFSSQPLKYPPLIHWLTCWACPKARHSSARGMLNTIDLPGRRKKGTGAWGGFACTSFFVDPETGIAAAVFGTQLVPIAANFDMAYETLWVEVEEAL
ncbi:hypothetical protein C8R47DRAFT_683262 [Mycena vitilis]|nr:hypothetical protein C8R47DRAFT_683262 [Mycena vitilis]